MYCTFRDSVISKEYLKNTNLTSDTLMLFQFLKKAIIELNFLDLNFKVLSTEIFGLRLVHKD